MLKEKVNTHFSFPLQLNMSGYMEKNLIPSISTDPNIKDNEDENEIKRNGKSDEEAADDTYIYELIGVTVHTGTAEGGHYYSFIRERDQMEISNENALNNQQKEKSPKW